MQLKRLGLFLVVLLVLAFQASAQNARPPGAGEGAALPQGVRDGWRERFEQMYRLEKVEVLRYIPPPFIADRWDYYYVEHTRATENHPEPPEAINFRWIDPPLQNVQIRSSDLDFGKNVQLLSDVLTRVLRLHFYEFEGPKPLLGLVLPGDWIIREGSQAPAMEELARILSQVRGKTVKIERETRPLDSIVISGDYQFKPLPQAGADRFVHEFIDTFETNEAMRVQQSVPFQSFVLQLEARLRIRFVNEVQTPPRSVPVAYHPSLTPDGKRPTTMASDETIRKLLDVISLQTGLKFTREQRPCEVWRISEDQ